MVKKIISIVTLVLVLLIIGTTIYKLVDRHNERLYDVLYSKIEYQAKRCYLEEKCNSNIVLSELYDKGYLDIQYDPISKEDLDRNLKIQILEDEVKIIN